MSLVIITECAGPSSPVLMIATPSSRLICLMSMSKEVQPSGVLVTLQLLAPFVPSMALAGILLEEAEEDTAFVGSTDGVVTDDGVGVSVAIWVPNELLVVVVESSLVR